MASGETFRLIVPSTPAAASHARRVFAKFLHKCAVDADLAADFETAVGEALANAVEHGRRAPAQIRCEARLSANGIEVRVADDGPGFLPQPWPRDAPDHGGPRGFGIYLMNSLMDDVSFEDGGRTVRLFKRHPVR